MATKAITKKEVTKETIYNKNTIKRNAIYTTNLVASSTNTL